MDDVAAPLMEMEQEVVSVSVGPAYSDTSGSSGARRQSQTPALVNRIPPPRNEEEWVDFIDNYIRYGFVTQSQLFLPPDAESDYLQGTQDLTPMLGDRTPIPEIPDPMQVEPTTPEAMEIWTPTSDYFSAAQIAQPDMHHRPPLLNVGSDETKGSHPMSTTCSTGSLSGSFDRETRESRRTEAHRVKLFYEQNGFMCAPAQLPKDTKKRLRAIRRLGFDKKDGTSIRRQTLDRYTRLLTSMLKAKMSTVTIIGVDSQLFPSEVGLGIESLGTDLGFCTHTSLSTEKPLVVENADQDWRFSKHPMVQSGAIKSYCGAPLRQGKNSAVIGTLCVIDDKPRPDFLTDAEEIVKELAACVSNELELLAKAEEQRLTQHMHDVALRFSQQWLQNSSSNTRIISHRKAKGRDRKGRKQVDIAMVTDDTEKDEEISVFDEACRVVAKTIGASCTLVDTSAFHISYPETEARSVPLLEEGMQRPRAPDRGDTWKEELAKSALQGGINAALSVVEEVSENEMAEDQPMGVIQPKVYHLPKRQHLAVGCRAREAVLIRSGVLGCSLSQPTMPENLPEVLTEVISHNLKTKKIWFEAGGDDPEEEFMKSLMGEHSAALVLPVFDYRGQVPFVFIACSSDDIFAFDSAALSFVESMCSTVLASALRNQLTVIDEAQRSFAAMANHELKTPLHQILMCANDLRETLEIGVDENKIPSVAEKEEMFKLCDIILAGAEKTQTVLNAVVEYHTDLGNSAEKRFLAQMSSSEAGEEMEDILAEALHDAVEQEKLKKAALGQDLSLVETIVELVPRATGWTIARDCRAIKRILENILINAYHATEEGYVLVTCEDISQVGQITSGYDATTPTVRIRVKDTGMGMSKGYCESGEIFEPFSKADKFSSGAGLGVTLAKRTIDQMGGTIQYESLPDKGTLVTIEVPLQIHTQRQNDNTASCGPNPTVAHVALIGFEDTSQFGIHVAGEFLKRKLQRRNALVCSFENANTVIVEERALNDEVVRRLQELNHLHDIDTIVLGSATSKRRWRSNPHWLDQDRTVPVRWLFRPLNPVLMRQILNKGRSSVAGDFERRRSSTWTTYSSRASLASAFSYAERPAPSVAGESVTSEESMTVQSPTRAVENVVEEAIAVDVSPTTDPTFAQPLGTALKAIRKCLPASDLKVLIVEDNAINRQVLARMIKKLGHPYEEAEDGVVGVAKYKTFRPHLVLTDIDMPRKTGLEASSDIRAYEAKLNLSPAVIVAVSAIKDDAAIARGKNECQINDWLVKPLGIKILTEKIRQLYDIQK